MKVQSAFWQKHASAVVTMWGQNNSATIIGKRIGKSRNSVLGWLHRNGYGRASDGLKNIRVPTSTLNRAASAVNSGENVYEVARAFGTSPESIKGHMLRLKRMA